MTSIYVRIEYLLEGISKFNMWKEKVLNILKEHDLDSFVNLVVKKTTYNVGILNYKKNQEKEKRTIYDSVKANLMSVITPLKTSKECFETVMNLYNKNAPTRKRDLNNMLHNL